MSTYTYVHMYVNYKSISNISRPFRHSDPPPPKFSLTYIDVGRSIDVVTNPTQTTPTHCGIRGLRTRLTFWQLGH